MLIFMAIKSRFYRATVSCNIVLYYRGQEA